MMMMMIILYTASFFWCAPALFTHLVPHFYYVYLAILLLDRAWRDDARY